MEYKIEDGDGAYMIDRRHVNMEHNLIMFIPTRFVQYKQV